MCAEKPSAPRSARHQVEYQLRCKKCGHEWVERSGWIPARCPECSNKIEHGDHLPAHLELLDARLIIDG